MLQHGLALIVGGQFKNVKAFLIVVYILGYAAYRHVTKKEEVLYLGLVNITAGSDLTEQLTTGFAEAQGLTKKQQVDLLSGLLLSESEHAEEQYVYASEMKLLGAVSAQRLDVVLMDEYARDRLLADDYFLDLRTLDASFHALSGLNADGTVLDISDEALKAAKIVHFGSVSLTADPSRTATLDAAARAKKLGATITYDPNYRANLWKNKEDAIAQMKAPLPLVDILKVSDEELPLLTGTTDCESGTAQLAQNGIRLIFVTLGANGVFYRFGDKTGHVAGVPCKVGDTNGAGDTFFGAALSKLCKEELDTLTVDKLESILAFANKAASITTSRHGAIPAMPTLAEVEG